MKTLLIFILMTLSLAGFAQGKKSLPVEIQKEKLIELDSITENMSFARKERYLDSLQNDGVILRKLDSSESKGCTLEDRETLFRKPKQEVIIFLEK